ncbi:unnamed protein product [Closterium sp. Naga37s-1]|nr:unnamed protein product [Closterium sp. Naga37s-1]
MASVSALSSSIQVSSVNTFAGKRLSVAQSSSRTVKLSAKRAAVSVKASSESTSSDDVSRREVLKAALVLGAAVPASAAGFLSFAPASSADELVAKDLSGKVVMADNWLATHKGGDRTLVQGLDDEPAYIVDEPAYIVVNDDGSLGNFAINAICTHMGCVVPWVAEENKFMCPCHGSQYNNQGMVVQGPAPLSLALEHTNVVGGKVVFSTWTETDFRTGEEPWWMED